MSKSPDYNSKGGVARAKALTAKERSEIAKKAATERWNSDLPVATHEGEFKVGDNALSAAVLPTGQRILSQSTLLRALGRARTLRAGTGVSVTGDELPIFLQAEALKPFIQAKIHSAAKPVAYRTKGGLKAVGYDARLLPLVAEVFLKYRDHVLQEKGSIPVRYQNTIKAADILVRGLANVGIIALVDEATGYQKDRAKDALSKILEEFIAKELRPWVYTFPNEFYDNLFRLKGLSYPQDKIKKPQYFGHITNNIIYSRLAPSILEELKKATPRDAKGRHKQQLHRRLTDDIGHPRLREHLAAVITLMRISKDYEQFIELLDRTHPKYGHQLSLPIDEPTSL